MTMRPPDIIALIAGIGLGLIAAGGAGAQADAARGGSLRDDIRDDLRTVVILAGYPCHSVVDYSAPAQDEYHLTCDADRHYGVRISEEDGIRVRNRSNPGDSGAGAGEGHQAFMQRQLFAIVNLAGHDCDSVLSYTHAGPRESVVVCGNQAAYRIRVTPEGRIAVKRQGTFLNK